MKNSNGFLYAIRQCLFRRLQWFFIPVVVYQTTVERMQTMFDYMCVECVWVCALCVFERMLKSIMLNGVSWRRLLECIVCGSLQIAKTVVVATMVVVVASAAAVAIQCNLNKKPSVHTCYDFYWNDLKLARNLFTMISWMKLIDG